MEHQSFSVETQLAVLNNKVDQILASQQERNKDYDDHESRIRTLEARKFPLPTIAVLISLAALIVTVVLYVQQK